MSKFNQYTWELYKRTEEWKNTSEMFSLDFLPGNESKVISTINPMDTLITTDPDFQDLMETIYSYNISEMEVPQDMIEAEHMYKAVLMFGITDYETSYVALGDYKNMLGYTVMLSLLCYYYAPEYFFPYLFRYRAIDLYKIADYFDIRLPELPAKSDYKSRCMYYMELCKTFYLFRTDNDLSPIELCAFLYDFAPKIIQTSKSQTMNIRSRKPWIIGGHISQEDKLMDVKLWQCNEETRRGDILVHYETSPVSAITRIWIAQTDGVIDPFFRYYANTYLGDEIEIPPITIKELKNDEYFSSHPMVKKNFQGVNGTGISVIDYDMLIEILRSKGFDANSLPDVYRPDRNLHREVCNEHEVEKEILEPYLATLGVFETTRRQIPIQSGRGTRIYPDYAVRYDEQYGVCDIIIEAKYHMKTSRDVFNAFNQAKSYALILQASAIVLCDKECFIIYNRTDEGFDRNKFIRYYWEDLYDPDVIIQMRDIFQAASPTSPK